MAFCRMIGGAVETAGLAVAAGVQLGQNDATNRAMKRAADKTSHNAVTVGLDTAGCATNMVAPALQAAGHAVATSACAVADVATLGKIDDLSRVRDEQAQMTKRKAEQAGSGAARLVGTSCLAFNSPPADAGPWMKDIPDDRLLSELFLPGTHDTMALYGGDLAQCQAWSLEDQLRSGIRCLDIRLRQSGDALCAHHGVVYQHRNFGSIRDALEAFLQHFPSETLLVRISGSGCNHDSKREFKPHVQSYIEGRPLWKKLGCNVARTPLHAARGSIIAFQGPFACTSLDCQDRWDLGNADKKWKRVSEHAQKKRSANVLYVNYLSSQGSDGMTYATPSGMAFGVNRLAHSEVASFQPGVYMMDYPGVGLVDKIVQRNAYQCAQASAKTTADS